MADWQTSLVDEATVNGHGQPDGHFRVVAAIAELRAAVDELDGDVQVSVSDVDGLEDALNGKADTGDIPDVSRFVSQSDFDALEDVLNGKADSADIPDVSGFVSQADFDALEARVTALEP